MAWTRTARLQAGLITRGQLRADGIPGSTINSWLVKGRLEATSVQTVFRVAGAPETDASRAWFAALSARSPVTYLSAARWWEMEAPDDGLVHITRLARRRLDWPAGVRVHRVALSTSALVCHRGLWVTTRPETVVDCMGWLPMVDARPFADRAIQQGWVSTTDIVGRLANQPGRWGNRQLRRLLDSFAKGAAESERRLHRLLGQADIDGWTANLVVTIAGRSYEIDVAFPDLKLAIEVDGFRYHSGDVRFQADRTKQNALIGAGWRVLRFTWADITQRSTDVVEQIRQLVLALARSA